MRWTMDWMDNRILVSVGVRMIQMSHKRMSII